MKLALFAAGLAVTVVVCWYILRRVRLALSHAEHRFLDL